MQLTLTCKSFYEQCLFMQAQRSFHAALGVANDGYCLSSHLLLLKLFCLWIWLYS
jgi:hypothetical protein